MSKILSQKNNSTPNSSSSFSCNQTRYRSIARADLQLPKSPNKKAEVIQRLATKYKLRINLRRRRKELSEDEKIWLIELLNQSDLRYTSIGRKDHVCVGKFNG